MLAPGVGASVFYPPENVTPPTLSGSPIVGQTLTTTNGTWQGTQPITMSYQWERCGPSNLIPNGTFETDANGWSTQPGGTVVRTTEQAYAGSYSLKTRTAGRAPQEGAVYTTSGLQAGVRYRYWFSIYAPATEEGFQFNVAVASYDAAHNLLDLKAIYHDFTLRPRWQKVTFPFVPPVGTATVELQIRHSHRDKDSKIHTFYVDEAWLNNCAEINGATGSSYAVTEVDVGARLLAKVVATNYAGDTPYPTAYPNQTDPVDIPTVLRVTLNPLVATSLWPNTVAQATDWGASVRSTIAGPGDAHRLRWNFVLGSGQSLALLSNGGLAVISRSASPDIVPEGDGFSDADPIDPAESYETSTTEDVPGEGFERLDVPYLEDNDGPPDYGPPTDDEGKVALDAIGSAQEELDEAVVAVASAPQARDAAGNTVAASFSISGNSAILTVLPKIGSTYPMTVDGELYEFLEEVEDTESVSAPGAVEALADDANCTFRPQIITYNPSGWRNLLLAFKANPTPCADYYIVIPGRANDKTLFRINMKDENEQTHRIVDVVCEGSNNSVDAKFYPVAEYHWDHWDQFWIQTYGKTWGEAATEFRKRMARGYDGPGEEFDFPPPGYGTRCNGTGPIVKPLWAINEFPDNPEERDKSILTSSQVQKRAVRLVMGLHDGPDGKKPGWRNTRGITFVVTRSHAEMRFRETSSYASYRDGLRTLLRNNWWWNSLRRQVLFWSQETYTNCWKVCLGTRRYQDPPDQALKNRGRLVTDYIFHPLLFLDAAAREGTPAEKADLRDASSFFRGATPAQGRYSPLLTAYWGPDTDRNAKPQYGETTHREDKPGTPEDEDAPALDLETMKGHVALQIYARRRQTVNHPQPRIGFAWYNAAGRSFADFVALSLRAAFSPGGTPEDACTVQGEQWCLRTVPPRTRPESRRTIPNICWEKNFRRWDVATVNCLPR
jgi:Carbohydrate binding domain